MKHTVKTTEVYYIDCEPFGDGSLFERLYGQMPAERKKKIDSYRFDNDKRLSLGAGYLTKTYNPDGTFYQNISHSGDIAVLAVSGHPIGVDIERIEQCAEDSKKKSQRMKVAERFFHEEEVEYLRRFPNNCDFLKIWTMKESYVKMLGTGFATDPRTFSVFDPELLEKIYGTSYTFTCYESITGYILSVCSDINSGEISVIENKSYL